MSNGGSSRQVSASQESDDDAIVTCMPRLERISDLAAVVEAHEGSPLADAAKEVIDQKLSAYEEVTAGFSQSQ